MQHEPHKHLTISIPARVKRVIEEKLRPKKLSLDEQYAAAAEDEERNREFKEWEDAMIGDGLDETNDW